MTIPSSKQFPKVPKDLKSIVKPEKLVDVVEMTPLSLQDRRNYNMLLGNAWNEIREYKDHWINKDELIKYTDSNNYDLPGSLRRLMASIVVLDIPNDENGEPEKRQIPLLGPNSFKEKRGKIKYSFPKELIDIIEKTQIFARLHTQVMFALSSKYSLAFYEWLQKRVNLTFINYEIVSIEDVRVLLGVPKNKLNAFGNLNKYAIKPAIKEVSFLTPYQVTAQPIKESRAVTAIKFSWGKKQDIGAQISAVEEIKRSKVGRKTRMNNQNGPVHPTKERPSHFSGKTNRSFPQISNISGPCLSTDQLEQGKEIARRAQTGWDIYAIEQQFYDYINRKGMPDNYNAAWIGFVKKKTKENLKQPRLINF